MQRGPFFTGVVAVLLSAAALVAQGGRQGGGEARGNQPPPINWNTKMPWASWEAGTNTWWNNFPRTAQVAEPFKIFDNYYYVGVQTVGAFLVATSDGLILVDATYADTADMVLDSIRKAGFDPVNVKYLVLTHGHFDHFAGAGRVKQVAVNARVATSALDWDLIERQRGAGRGNTDPGLPLKRDLVISDLDTIKLGTTTLKFYITPGHSPAALAIEMQGRLGGKSYRMLNPSLGLLNVPANMTDPYIKSVERLKQLGPWDSVIPPHTFLTIRDPEISPKDFFVGVAPKKPKGPIASVQGAAAINAWFDEILKVAHQKLETEQKQSRQTAER